MPRRVIEERRRATSVQSFLLATGFALALTLCFPRPNWWLLAYVALYPLLAGIYLSRSPLHAFWFSYLSGFLFLVFSLLWVRHVTLAGLIVFALLDALAFGFFGFLAKKVFSWLIPESAKRIASLRLAFAYLILPALWVAQEYLRVNVPVIGFGFNLLGHSQAQVPVVAQSARILGTYGISYFVALVNVTFFLVCMSRIPLFRWPMVYVDGRGGQGALLPSTSRVSVNQCMVLGAVTLCLMLSVVTYGRYALATPPAGPVVRVGVVQGNVGQQEKWELSRKPLIIDKYKKLTQLATYDGPDLLAWPEAAYPGYFNLEFKRAAFQTFLNNVGIPIIIGSPHWESASEVYNSAYLTEPEKGIVDRYDKVNLVPFGEYVPLGPFFRVFGIEQYARAMGVSDFSFGKDAQKVFTLHHKERADIAAEHAFRFSTLICFEDGFPAFCRNLVNHGAQFLLVMTNDAWFRESAAPYQHLQCSIMRAIENGVYVIRAANTGVSAFVNPKGIVEDRVHNAQGHDIFVAGALTRPIFTSSATTPYREFGYVFPLLCLVLGIPAIFLRR